MPINYYLLIRVSIIVALPFAILIGIIGVVLSLLDLFALTEEGF